MKDKSGIFIRNLFVRPPNKLYWAFLGGFNEFQGDKVNEWQIWNFL